MSMNQGKEAAALIRLLTVLRHTSRRSEIENVVWRWAEDLPTDKPTPLRKALDAASKAVGLGPV